jgi:hypothetical protein
MPANSTARVSRGHLPLHPSPDPPHMPPLAESRPIRPYSLSTLLQLSQTTQILFRVHDVTSSSPLFWTGRSSISGFSAPNLNLAYLEPIPYSRVYNYTSNSHGFGWAEGRYIRHTILDHVLGKEKQSCLPTVTSIDERPDTPEDEKTPWISASVDLMWCLYEVIRRLVAFELKEVCITVIKHPHAKPGSKTTKNGASSASSHTNRERPISRASDSSTRRDEDSVRELMVDPYPLLHLSHQRVKDLLLSVGMKENYEIAARSSRHTSERLFWGRVFTESILYNMEFTMKVCTLVFLPSEESLTPPQHTPLALPAQFYKASKQAKPSRINNDSERQGESGGWTNNLVWDPRVDAFDTAYRKVLERRKALAKLAGEEMVCRFAPCSACFYSDSSLLVLCDRMQRGGFPRLEPLEAYRGKIA